MKQLIKKLIRYIFLSRRPSVVVASTGRAGSTLLFQALGRAYLADLLGIYPTSKWAKRLSGVVSGYCERFDCIRGFGGGVIKTHALWHNNKLNNVKFIFIHGDPLESAISVEKMAMKHGVWWFDKHVYHLELPGGKLEDIYSKDVLNYQAQIESWGGCSDARVLCVAYEDLWDRIEDISLHVGFSIILPTFNPREVTPQPERYDEDLFLRLREKRRHIFGNSKNDRCS